MSGHKRYTPYDDEDASIGHRERENVNKFIPRGHKNPEVHWNYYTSVCLWCTIAVITAGMVVAIVLGSYSTNEVNRLKKEVFATMTSQLNEKMGQMSEMIFADPVRYPKEKEQQQPVPKPPVNNQLQPTTSSIVIIDNKNNQNNENPFTIKQRNHYILTMLPVKEKESSNIESLSDLFNKVKDPSLNSKDAFWSVKDPEYDIESGMYFNSSYGNGFEIDLFLRKGKNLYNFVKAKEKDGKHYIGIHNTNPKYGLDVNTSVSINGSVLVGKDLGIIGDLVFGGSESKIKRVVTNNEDILTLDSDSVCINQAIFIKPTDIKFLKRAEFENTVGFKNPVSFYDATTFEGRVIFNQDLNINKKITIKKQASFEDKTTFSGPVVFDKQLTINGELNIPSVQKMQTEVSKLSERLSTLRGEVDTFIASSRTIDGDKKQDDSIITSLTKDIQNTKDQLLDIIESCNKKIRSLNATLLDVIGLDKQTQEDKVNLDKQMQEDKVNLDKQIQEDKIKLQESLNALSDKANRISFDLNEHSILLDILDKSIKEQKNKTTEISNSLSSVISDVTDLKVLTDRLDKTITPIVSKNKLSFKYTNLGVKLFHFNNDNYWKSADSINSETVGTSVDMFDIFTPTTMTSLSIKALRKQHSYMSDNDGINDITISKDNQLHEKVGFTFNIPAIKIEKSSWISLSFEDQTLCPILQNSTSFSPSFNLYQNILFDRVQKVFVHSYGYFSSIFYHKEKCSIYAHVIVTQVNSGERLDKTYQIQGGFNFDLF